MQNGGADQAQGGSPPRALSIHPRFPLTSWPASPSPNEIRFALPCGARARAVISIDPRECRCPGEHAPSAVDLAGEIWMEYRDELDHPGAGDEAEDPGAGAG